MAVPLRVKTKYIANTKGYESRFRKTKRFVPNEYLQFAITLNSEAD